MQRNCIFPGRYAPLTYYVDVLEASRNTLMARNVKQQLLSVKQRLTFFFFFYFFP